MKKLLFLLAFALITTQSYSQKLKTYFIKSNGEKSSKMYANFKRSVQNKEGIWVVQDYYLNDSLRMTGHFLDKYLTQKTNTFTYYHPNGELSGTVLYKNNSKNGTENFYYINGNLSQVANYNMGEATGKWIWYNEDGSIENELDNVTPNILSENYSHAEYVGGQTKLNEYLKKSDYGSLPKGSIAIYDRTFTTFQINEDGKVTDVDIIIHGTKEMDSAIIKHLYNMPKWIAKKKNGKYITSNYVLPIRFSKQSKEVLTDKIIGEAFFASGVEDYKEENYEKAIFKLLQAIRRNHMAAKYYYLLGS